MTIIVWAFLGHWYFTVYGRRQEEFAVWLLLGGWAAANDLFEWYGKGRKRR